MSLLLRTTPPRATLAIYRAVQAAARRKGSCWSPRSYSSSGGRGADNNTLPGHRGGPGYFYPAAPGTGGSNTILGSAGLISAHDDAPRHAQDSGSRTSNLPQRRQLTTSAISRPHSTRSISTTTTATTTPPEMYTTSFAFFEALWDAGVTHCFVNLGSDHPSIIEAMVKGAREKKGQFPRIITCPNEMVAMSMADGYARLTNKPQAVIVHVDVGTQGLGAAMHNSSSGRAPVLVFAGLSPFTLEGELRGSRTEYIHWIQDVPDQKQIVAQYCRYAAELKTGANVKQMVNRALQFARSAPQGPVYLCGAREVMEMDIAPYTIRQEMWKPVELGGLPTGAAQDIAAALAGAKAPLVITGYAGRNHAVPGALVELADTVKGLRVLDTGGSEMCFPADHPAWLGLRFGNEEAIRSADVILVVDCDVPWVQTLCKPRADAKVYHVDVDPLKQMMPVFYIDAVARYRADALTAIEQVTGLLKADEELKAQLGGEERDARRTALEVAHKRKLELIAARCEPLDDGAFGTGHLCARLRELCPDDTLWAIEAVTNTVFVHDALQPTMPGSWINCGGGGLGWSGGGALGIKLATEYEAQLAGGKGKFVVQIVGDGTFLFSVPGSVYWIARRYNIPVLTIVLNNKGWNAPRRSLELVHPDGLGSKATNEEINISFAPVLPDYGGIAKAAAGGDVFVAKVDKAADLDEVLRRGIEAVQSGQSAVLDCKVAMNC
ncbi:thiamine pyrophosphate enzyme, N-terminal TPP binding domain-containing protein [Podospora appendiculata]|uniref:Thiamine pyrophosphate enzyme, N-terminal TPP binding domain-containing protein n=1 Tax=Podospora appendiculata TaxID=314037 RepID=A0AAE1C7L0_9PEZI|nr:thiamine pyrophosphate enzyme, N-terminal TPP binding domain-containing protein [Podospora appendiculata]